MQCPDCTSEIAQGAKVCLLCGWRSKTIAPREPAVVIPCAHSGCNNPAVMYRKLRHGWANLCRYHDLHHVQVEADEFCRERGLKTNEEKRAWRAATQTAPKPTSVECWREVIQRPGATSAIRNMALDVLKRRDEAWLGGFLSQPPREPGQEG